MESITNCTIYVHKSSIVDLGGSNILGAVQAMSTIVDNLSVGKVCTWSVLRSSIINYDYCTLIELPD